MENPYLVAHILRFLEQQTSLEADTKVPLKTQPGLFSSGLRTEMR